MVVVTRRNKLDGARAIVGGTTDLILVFVDPRRAAQRRMNLAFGATSVVVGIGQVRGSKLLYRSGLAAMFASLAGMMSEDLGSLRSRPRARAKKAGSPIRPADGKEPTSAERRAEIRAAIPPPAPGDRLRGARSIVTGGISIAAAADRSLARSQRVVGVAGGALVIVGGVAQLRSSVTLKVFRAYAMTIFIPVGVASAVVQGVQRIQNR